VSDWIVLLVCLGYGVVAWLVQAYRVVPPRDWLLERISYLLNTRLPKDKTAWGIRADLEEIRTRVDHWFIRVGASRVQAGWRNVHGLEDDLLLHDSDHVVDERLRTISTRLARIKGDEAKSFTGRIDKAFRQQTPSYPERRALLREASAFRHNYSDEQYEDRAGLLGKAVFLTFVALAIVVALAGTLDRESWFLLGAAGALISRLSRVTHRRPSPSDYGAEWSTLILSPALGALAGWVGVAILVVLSNPPFDVLDDRFSELWSDPKKPLGLVLAFAFGFSERLFNRLLNSAVSLVGGSLPEESTQSG
jgi:hypothetical protein